jgi:putative lipase involved disintegration of autophagic bodies
MAETLLELETRLVQAKEARHRLLTGTQEVSVSLQGYGSTTYTASNVEAWSGISMNWNCRFPVPKAAHGAGLSGQVFKAGNGAIIGFIRTADESVDALSGSDTAHRAASVKARELASWMPLLGSADSDLCQSCHAGLTFTGFNP